MFFYAPRPEVFAYRGLDNSIAIIWFGVSIKNTDYTLNLNWGENKQFTALRIPT